MNTAPPGSALAELSRRKALAASSHRGAQKEAPGIRFQRRLQAKSSSLAHDTAQTLWAPRTGGLLLLSPFPITVPGLGTCLQASGD